MATGTGERRVSVTVQPKSGVTRGGDARDTSASSLAGALESALDEAFDVVDAREHRFELPPRTRGEAAGLPTADVAIAIAGPAVLLVEDPDTGRVRWVLPTALGRPPTRGRAAPDVHFSVPLDDALAEGATRGITSAVAKRIIRVLVPKVADHLLHKAGLHFARWWEESHRREGLRTFDPTTFSVPVPELGLGFQDVKRLSAGRSLLFLHGTMAQAHTGFGSMPPLFMQSLATRYDGRLWAYDHFTLSRAPGDNAELLLDDLRRLARRDQHFDIDVIAHSRGGLVARELAELSARAEQVNVRSITFMATPNAGTPVCSASNLDTFVSQITNLLTFIPDNPVVDALDTVLALVKHLLVGAYEGIDGVRAMDPDDKRLAALNLGRPPEGVTFFGVGSAYEPAPGSPAARRLRDATFDRVMGGAANDLLVPVDSVRSAGGVELVQPPNWLQLDRQEAVDHGGYWRSTRTLNWVLGRLGAALTEAPEADGQPGEMTARSGVRSAAPIAAEPIAGTDGSSPSVSSAPVAPVVEAEPGKVRVTLVHGSLEHADFPVIVGHYDDAPIRGAEGVVDSRLDGVLSRHDLIGRYPAQIGESLFLRAPEDDVQYPVGVYVIGLGQTGELNKGDLTTAVTKAVLDRCLRLYQHEGERHRSSAAHGSRKLGVGVSSVLIGSSLDAGGLAVDTSLAAIVEGIVRANQSLERYEQESPSLPKLPSVRVMAIQIIERYADRCELASRALVDIVDLVGSERAAVLDVVTTPEMREGALPPRPPAAELSETWSRFVVTASDAERLNRDRAEASQDPNALGRELELDVSYLGRLARVDRALHRIDRVAVDQLIEQAMEASDGESQTASTLYELLFPREFKREVAHATELHLIVDEYTANYPWELLAMRTLDGERRVLSLAAGLLRQFRESNQWRWSTRRARKETALVIGNPPVTTHPPLQGAADEALAVTGMLTRHGYEVRSLVWDASGNFVGLGNAPRRTAAGILDALFERDYRIIHIASHGEVVDDPTRPGEIVQASSGALIGDDLVISGTTIRQLPVMPELFFLNCCHLARVGINRLSAGIARELMAGGVRAVVAAGWPVSDIAAVRFAVTLYESLLTGADYATSVESGRARARDGSNTWAAYQCYGVPGFRLHTGQRPSDEPPRAPLTTDELLRRVTTCTVTAGDISRPEAVATASARQRLIDELDVLAGAAESHPTWSTPEICEALGAAYADFGSAEQGMRWYRKATEGGVRKSGHRLSSLEQLANLEARFAQQLALGRTGAPAVSTAQSREVIDGLFEDASQRIERLIEAASLTDERLALRASLAKKHAACLDPSDPRRVELVRKAAEAYEAATGTDAYQRQNAAQLRAVLGEPPVLRPAPREPSPAPPLLIDQQPFAADYWARVMTGDELLTELMQATTERQRKAKASEMTAAYRRTFGTRSSYRQRTQTLDHMQDLALLLPVDDPRRVRLEEAVSTLSAWTGPNGEGAAPAPGAASNGVAAVEPRAARRSPRGRRQRSASVQVEALPASYGDAILVTYGDDRQQSRMLIDAGPASAYKKEVRSRLGDLHLDLFVITHVDADHIDGAIQLLLDEQATFDDIWFNGWHHLPPARGGREGAILDALLDGKPWNLAFDGGVIRVPDAGPLPSVMVAGGARVTLLSPVPEGLQRLRRTWQRALEDVSVQPGNAAEALALLATTDRFEETTRGGNGAAKPVLGKDGSVPNGSSIAFLFEFGHSACLFGGDAHAPVLASSLRRLAAERDVPRIKLDLFKLAHHGSRGNISSEVLELIDCDRFLVSTDGSKFNHPDADAIQAIAKHGGDGKIYVNYPQVAAREDVGALVLHNDKIELTA
ncbi:MAG: CHAT domain-containing protein [Acidimicrobiia bacterium]